MNVWRLTMVTLLLAGCSAQHDAATSRKQPAQPPNDEIEPDAAATAPFNWKSTDRTVTHLLFAPDDDRLVVSVLTEEVKLQINILSIANTKENYRFEALSPISFCISPDGSLLAMLDDDELTLHDIAKKQISVRIDRETFDPEIQSLGFAADGAILVGAVEYLDPEKEQIAWNTTTGETVPVPAGTVTWHGRGLSQDGTMFFSGGWPGPTPRIYKTDRTGRITYCFYDEWPIAAAFTPDSKNLVTIHEDGLLVVWEIKETGNDNARQLVTERGFDDCKVFAISHDRKRIATAEKDGSIRIRKMPTGG